MVTLQEYLNEKYPTKENKKEVKKLYVVSGIDAKGEVDLREFESLEDVNIQGSFLVKIDLSSCINLKSLTCPNNDLTSVEFLNTLPNPEKLEKLQIFDNNIQPTDIEIFNRFVNLRELRIGTTENALKQGKRNRFYGSLKSYQNLTKLEVICIETTDVNEGLEYLPMSLVKATRGGNYYKIECSPHNTNAKCSAIQNQLRPYNYDIEVWQLSHSELMSKVRKEQNPVEIEHRLEEKITETVEELRTIHFIELNKGKQISRLESKLKILEDQKKNLEEKVKELEEENRELKANSNKELEELVEENQQLKNKIRQLETNEENLEELRIKFLEEKLVERKELCMICERLVPKINWKDWCFDCSNKVEIRLQKDQNKTEEKVVVELIQEYRQENIQLAQIQIPSK